MKEITQDQLDRMQDRDPIARLVWLRMIARGEARITPPPDISRQQESNSWED